jgi:hypothetical protein
MSARHPDYEITVMNRFCRDLATLAPPARRRVLAYVCARVEALPVVAAVGGGTEDDSGGDGGLFSGVPDMPTLKGAA